MMKRLFQINKPSGKLHVVETRPIPFYESKRDAKKDRDALNAEHPTGGYTVAPGPDHRNFRE